MPAYARIRGARGARSGPAVCRPGVHDAARRGGPAPRRSAAVYPGVISLLAPGFNEDPERFAIAVELTRITFPYLLLVTLVTLYGGILNALAHFAAPAAAPILLNLSMMTTLALAAFFPSAGHAAAWGVFIAGCLEAVLVAGDLWRVDRLPTFHALRLDDDVRRFFRALGPATLGSAGTQIALFADTIIASFLPAGAVSALYYADRLNQLPIGVIGIAVGTVLLPEMAHRIVAGDEAGSRQAQNRAIEFALLLAIPCVVAFALVPDLIMRALFSRGAFTAADAAAAGATLSAYAIGLLPFVLLRAVSSSFLARGDTATPVKALLVSVVVNVALKILLMGRYAQVGLAFATSIGVWVNFLLLTWFALRAKLITVDVRLRASTVRLATAGLVLAATLLATAGPVIRQSESLGTLRFLGALAALAALGGVAYGGSIAAMFGRRWFYAFGHGA